MNIAELIKEHHKMMIERGFYDCPECHGLGEYYQMNPDCSHCPTYDMCEKPDSEFCCIPSKCETCTGSKINPNKNIGELLALIVGELCGEALEAHRCNRFADWESYERGNQQLKNSCSAWKDIKDDMMFTKEGMNYFLSYIKDTFEDEIADVFLRLFDLCGYLDIELFFEESYNESNDIVFNNVGEDFYFMMKTLPVNIQMRLPHIYNKFFTYLVLFSEHHQIPIEKHIKSKMAYNRTRPHKHGKEY